MAIEIALFNGSKETEYPGYRRRVLGEDWLSWEFVLRRFIRKGEISFAPASAEGEGKHDALEDFYYSKPFDFNGIGLFLYEPAVKVAARRLIAFEHTFIGTALCRAGQSVSLVPEFRVRNNDIQHVWDERDRLSFIAIAAALCSPAAVTQDSWVRAELNARAQLEEAKPCSP